MFDDGQRGRVAFVGEEPLVAQCADAALAAGLEVAVVVSANPVVRSFADGRGIAVADPGTEASALSSHRVDILFSVANLRMLPAAVLAQVSTAINFHDGPLPAYVGLNVTTWALLRGEVEHAVTWHHMTAEADAGAIVATETFPIAADETAFSLNARCYEAALATFPAIAAAVAAGDVPAIDQPAGARQVFKRHDRPGLLVDPRRPAAATAREVRALDLGHRWPNTVGVVRLVVGGTVFVLERVDVVEASPGRAAGTVVELDADHLRLATDGSADLVVTALRTADGRPVDDIGHAVRAAGAELGSVIEPSTVGAELPRIESALARHEQFWLRRVAEAVASVPVTTGGSSPTWSAAIVGANPPDEASLIAAVAIWLGRTTNAERASFAIVDADARRLLDRLGPLARPGLSHLDVDPRRPVPDLITDAAAEIAAVTGRGVLLDDAIGRDPEVRGEHPSASCVVHLGGDRHVVPDRATVRIWLDDEAGLSVEVLDDDPGMAARIAEQLGTVLTGVRGGADGTVGDVDVVGPEELATLDGWNRTQVEHDRNATIDGLVRAQAGLTPDAPAVTAAGVTLTYAELLQSADRFGAALAAAGVGPRSRVGIAVPRGIEMVVAVLGVLGRGAAYVPLDPTYPLDRLRFMIDDAGLAGVVAHPDVAAALDRPAVPTIAPGAGASADAAASPLSAADHAADDLAYVIYTSGSTGLPKGVMLEHRQVSNFFVAMDAVIGTDEPGVWLAVTSLSFDISVLELLWTLSRGYHVVVKADSGVSSALAAGRAGPARDVSFSLFYFAAGEAAAADGYRLLLDSARFADRHGFEAVWTPERHFHAFGASYPNPSVTGAALAATTSQVAIRAGSVVLPLHSPIRVAEEWAVVDNLSNGRVGISFAAGWQPNDFVLNPAGYANAREQLPASIDTVRRLWRGETVDMPGHDGALVPVVTLPRPVQPDLPVWLTSAGSPATFERAGALGFNVLTHLLGQSVEQLAANVQRYRDAWTAAGHAGEGRVTLMLHTFLDRDGQRAREVAREPMKGYLGTAVGLLKDVASAFPTFAGRGTNTDDLFASLTPDEMDQLLEVAAARYLDTSGLFGTPDEAVAMVEAVAGAGVDEVACLIDFGVPTEEVLASLDLLLRVKEQTAQRRDAVLADADGGDDSVHALIARYGVTHLQCTPSLAAMLAVDPDDRASLPTLRHLMLGGEALPSALADELRSLLTGRFTNMYGPTETTIWSLVHELDEIGASVPIGRPIANTTMFVLDAGGRRLPIGAYGELHLGGEGVARGYHDRPELTAERFVDRPGLGRVYATGDVVRIGPDGIVEFGGRADNQIKIRGHRIELGEIESLIDTHPAVVQSVVVARETDGVPMLVAFVIARSPDLVAPDDIRRFVADSLPDAMVPGAVMIVDSFPLTPNGKIDRKALPSVIGTWAAADTASVPDDDDERVVAAIWTEELARPVGRDDNFFDIGGHSLLAVKVFRRLVDETGAALALTDIFRYPTVRQMGRFLRSRRTAGESGEAAAVLTPTAADRGEMRRRARQRRE